MVLESKIDQFLGKLSLGRTFFEDAAKLLVTMIDEDPYVCEQILKSRRADWLTKDILDTFEAIGRKQIALEVMFLPKHIINRMIALPVEQQAQLADATVRVSNGARNHWIEKPLRKLTSREAMIVIGPKGIRTPEEQQAVIVENVKVVGCFELTVMNGKAFLKRCEHANRAQRVKLDSHGQAIIEIVS